MSLRAEKRACLLACCVKAFWPLTAYLTRPGGLVEAGESGEQSKPRWRGGKEMSTLSSTPSVSPCRKVDSKEVLSWTLKREMDLVDAKLF